jgi:hypothetical protein
MTSNSELAMLNNRKTSINQSPNKLLQSFHKK